ncbi:RagB/SusD family nutrient uptake outer membrane protein [Petrimonas mucosa]|uniref:RagB/SusD family nutrient uptake outer membrane protein n=1 Tax=Petrimonas mucosa TaxID=1642646 RepID=UPI001752F2BA|nr:RagB/SusD family nutrient uptake outer membrane protein [Petrimonas mucosa]HHT29864.1 RagB/SusD family nutrient uptake outer membrane protein [Petrimonas mucosa]
MKKIYIMLSLASLLFVQCADFLDQDNRSNVPANDFYKTEAGYESLMNSAYSSLRSIYNMQPLVFSAGTDLYGDGKSQGVVMNYYKSLLPSEGNVLDFYTRCYQGIQLANSVIFYGDITEESPVRSRYVDEARFIRAFFYFQLVQQFGAIPLSTEMYTSAVMNFERASLKDVYDFIISEFTALAGSQSQLLSRADSGVGRANKRAAAFFAAKAYLTRAYLNGTGYEAQEENIAQSDDYQNALTYAQQAINSELPSISIEDAFSIDNEENSEIFWSVQFSVASLENPSSDGSYQQAQFGSYLGGSEYQLNKSIDGNMAPALNLLQKYSRGDGRLEQTFMLELHGSYAPTFQESKNGYFNFYTAPTSSPIWVYYAPPWATDEDIDAWKADDPYGIKTNAIISKSVAVGGVAPNAGDGSTATWEERRHMDFGVPCIRKFDDYTTISNRSTTCSTHDVVVARLGEAYLIAAEAYIGMSKFSEAADMINKLRQRPGTTKPGFTTSMTVQAGEMNINFILDERAREMAGEYVRWTDLKRTHKLIEYVTQYNEDGVSESDMTGPDGKYKILRPIPQDAIDKNQTKVSQNPGY